MYVSCPRTAHSKVPCTPCGGWVGGTLPEPPWPNFSPASALPFLPGEETTLTQLCGYHVSELLEELPLSQFLSCRSFWNFPDAVVNGDFKREEK